MPTENRSSNTEMVSELLPCPFCGQQDFLIERLDSDASVVICQGLTGPHEACLARGPVGVVQDESEEQPGRDRAVELWNARAKQLQSEPVGEVVAFGKGLHEIAWAAGRMPRLGAKLYTHADPGEVERLKQELLVARAQGRAEVVEMIIALEAETGLDEFIGSHQIGCTGEWGSHWKEDDLRNHFDVDPAAAGELERYRHSGYEIILLEEERDNLSAQLAERDALLRRCLMAVREQHCDEDEADFDLPANLMTEIDVALDGKS